MVHCSRNRCFRLQEGRPVETATRIRREKLLADFVAWLSGFDIGFDLG